MSQIFYVGSYTNADFGTYKATGKGIYTCRLEPETGNMELLGVFEDVVNPTYLTLNRAGTQPLRRSRNEPREQSVRIGVCRQR